MKNRLPDKQAAKTAGHDVLPFMVYTGRSLFFFPALVVFLPQGESAGTAEDDAQEPVEDACQASLKRPVRMDQRVDERPGHDKPDAAQNADEDIFYHLVFHETASLQI